MDATVTLADSISYLPSIFGKQSSHVDDAGKGFGNSSSYEASRSQTLGDDFISESTSGSSTPVPAERKRRASRIVASQQGQVEVGLEVSQKVCDSEGEGKDRTNGTACIAPRDESKTTEGSKPYINLIVDELVDTEETYVKDLGEVVTGYLNCFEQLTSSTVSEEDYSVLFSNIRAILEFNRSFLLNLKGNRDSPVQIANCFVNQIEGFMIYTEYCTNYPRSVKVWSEITANKVIAKSLDERKRALGHSLPLSAFLFKPVQRILKYHLLLHNIVGNHEGDAAGHDVIVTALNCMVDIARHINEMKRQHERMLRTHELQEALASSISKDIKLLSFGDLILEDDFRVSGSSSDRHVILFSRALFIAKKLKDGSMQIKTTIRLSNLSLVENVAREPCYFRVSRFDSTKQVFMLQAKCLDQKNIWCQEIKKLMIENHPSAIPERAKQVLGLESKEDEARPRSGSLQAVLALRQQSGEAPKNSEKRRSRRKSADLLSKEEMTGNRVPSLYDHMTQSIDDVTSEPPQRESLARKRSTSHTSILNAIRSPLCNGWGGETDAIPPERGRTAERQSSKQSDRRSVSLDSSYRVANKDASSTEVDSDESSSSVEPKSVDDGSLTVFDDCSSIRSGTDSEHTDITDGEYAGKTNVKSSIHRFEGHQKALHDYKSGPVVRSSSSSTQSSSSSTAVLSHGDRDSIRRRDAMRADKRGVSPGSKSEKICNGLGKFEMINTKQLGVTEGSSANSVTSKLPPIDRDIVKKDVDGVVSWNGSGLHRSNGCCRSNNKPVGKVSVDVDFISSTERPTRVAEVMPVIIVEQSTGDEESDTVGQLNDDDEDIHSDWPQNYVFQLARAFSYRAKKTNASSSRRPRLDPSVFQQSTSRQTWESEKAFAPMVAETTGEKSADPARVMSDGKSEWSDRSRSASFDDDLQLTAAVKRNVRETIRLFDLRATSRSSDRLNSTSKIVPESASIEIHPSENEREALIGSRMINARSVSVGRPARPTGSLVQERMKVFESR